MHDQGLIIDGRMRPSSDNATFQVFSPADGSLVGTAASATGQDIDDAVRNAHSAHLAWAARTSYDRERTMRAATRYARTMAAHIGHVMAQEQGKPAEQAVSEVNSACDFIDYYSSEATRIEGFFNPTESPDLRSWVVYQPVGVCGLITPWNYPVSLLSWKLGPALATGCAVVVKPSSAAPLSPALFCQALNEGGLPAGLVNVVTGGGATVGECLARHPLIAKIAMTGSTVTGKRLLETCAPHLTKVSLELGGHCPAIVCDDADLDIAARIIVYKGFRNCGQSCSSINRVYAHRSIHDTLVLKIKNMAQAMSIGDGVSDGTVDLGPMTTADGRRTVEEHVRDALENGAMLVCGGARPDGPQYEKGNYYLPTVLTGCTREMRVMREETFGPVVPFAAFDSIENAVAAANDTSYGLVSYLFTKNISTAIPVAELLEAGTVCVNNGNVNTAYGPYCGWKESGYGVELSRRAVFEYLKVKHIKMQVR